MLKNQYMRLYYFLVLALALGMSGCSAPDTFHTLTGTWMLDRIVYPDEGVVETEPDHIARPVILKARDRGKRGSYTAETVTNVIEGDYRIDEAGNLSVESLDGTLFGEPDWGEKFRRGWRLAESYEIQPGQLIVRYYGGLVEMHFLRVP